MPVDGPLTEADVRAWVAQAEEAPVGRDSYFGPPESVSVTFHEVRLGRARPAQESDRRDGISGPTVYPAQVRYTSVRRYASSEPQTVETHYRHFFYEDEFGEGAALGLGPVR